MEWDKDSSKRMRISVSILRRFLIEACKLVLHVGYGNWELCLD